MVANARPTKLDRFATVPVRYRYDEAVGVLNGFLASAVGRGLPADLDDKRAPGLSQLQSGLGGVEDAYPDASEALLSAENLLIFAGGEGLSLAEHRELMQAAANLLIVTGRAGRKNSGLVAVWPGPNMQGAYDMGFSAEATQALLAARPKMWIIGGANPVEEDPRMAEAIRDAEFVVATAQFMTPTAEAADIVLPRQSFAERSGSFTNGLRRVQRFNPVQAETRRHARLEDFRQHRRADQRAEGADLGGGCDARSPRRAGLRRELPAAGRSAAVPLMATTCTMQDVIQQPAKDRHRSAAAEAVTLRC